MSAQRDTIRWGDIPELVAMIQKMIDDNQPLSSVELGRNASGATTISVKQYAPTVAAAYDAALLTYQQACEDYQFTPKAAKP